MEMKKAEHKKVVYILGCFNEKGLEHYAAVEEMLTELGYETISRVLIPEGMDRVKENRIAIAMMDAADAVVLLPNLEDSDDAVAERYLAYSFDKPMVLVKLGHRNVYDPGVNPPDIVKAWLKHDLEKALWEVSA